MSQRYQLPCPSCSTVLEVATTQAGETLNCSCGEQLLVPTLRELRQLDTVDDATDGPQANAWNPVRGALFVAGFLMIAMAAVGAWQIHSQRKKLDIEKPAFREMAFDVQTLTPMRAWEAWTYFRDQSLEFRDTPEFVENRRKHRELTGYLYALGALGAVGAILTGVSLFIRGQTAARDGGSQSEGE